MAANPLLPSAHDVAAAIIECRPGVDQMQLHKLLYLVQGASLVWLGVPAFEDQRIEAWRYGPMVRGVAGVYKDFGSNPIPEPLSGDSEVVSDELGEVIDRIIGEFGDLSGPRLAKITKRRGSPWRQVRGDLSDDESSDEEIPREMIDDFHRMHGLRAEKLTDDEKWLASRFLTEGDDDALADLFEVATGVRPTVS